MGRRWKPDFGNCIAAAQDSAEWWQFSEEAGTTEQPRVYWVPLLWIEKKIISITLIIIVTHSQMHFPQ